MTVSKSGRGRALTFGKEGAVGRRLRVIHTQALLGSFSGRLVTFKSGDRLFCKRFWTLRLEAGGSNSQEHFRLVGLTFPAIRAACRPVRLPTPDKVQYVWAWTDS